MELIILFSVIYYFRLCNCDQHQQQQHYFISAKQNNDTIASKGKCDLPKPVIVYPDDVHPNKYIGQQFIPRGTILYQCADSIGCCQHFTQKCVAVENESEQIDIEFLVSSHSNRKRPKWVTHVVRFTNHTRCECRVVSEQLKFLPSTLKNGTALTANIKIGFIVMSSITIIVMLSVIVLVALYCKRYRQYKHVNQNQTVIISETV